MRFGLVFAIGISVVMIGIASWTRFGPSEPSLYAISVEQNSNSNEASTYQELVDIYLGQSTTTPPAAKSLSDTDLIGRQLMIDYIDLATSGQASESALASLADRYVESIPTLNKTVFVNPGDIEVIPNSASNFKKYADELVRIHKQYERRIATAYVGDKTLNILGNELYSLSKAVSRAYTEAGEQLKVMPVPASLAQAHLKLVNSYLSSGEAMMSVSETEKDSASAFAGLVLINSNLQQEDVLLDEISKILTENGV